MRAKYDYVVKVITKNQEERFVTKTEGHTAMWEEGKEALKMSKDKADDVMLGLTLNFIPAMVIKTVNGVFKFTNE